MPIDLSPEWGRAVLPLAVLAVIRDRRELHGYAIVQALRGAGVIDVTSGTLYPLLRRAESEGLIASEWQESTGAPPRRVYRLTRVGQARMEAQSAAWATFSARLNELLHIEERADGEHGR